MTEEYTQLELEVLQFLFTTFPQMKYDDCVAVLHTLKVRDDNKLLGFYHTFEFHKRFMYNGLIKILYTHGVTNNFLINLKEEVPNRSGKRSFKIQRLP